MSQYRGAGEKREYPSQATRAIGAMLRCLGHQKFSLVPGRLSPSSCRCQRILQNDEGEEKNYQETWDKRRNHKDPTRTLPNPTTED